MKNLNKIVIVAGTLALIGASVTFCAEPARAGKKTLEIVVATDGGNAKTAAPIGNAIAGSTIYSQYCSACHQPDGKGLNSMLAADLTKPERLNKSNEELLDSISKGVQGKIGFMPGWGGTLTEQQMKDVLQYIRDEFTQAKK